MTTVCRNAMQMVGLDPELSRRVGQYSQGMRQRLSLARAVLHDPEVILLDEPFSNVDVRSARDMAAVLGRLRDTGQDHLRRHPSGCGDGEGRRRVRAHGGRADRRSRTRRARTRNVGR